VLELGRGLSPIIFGGAAGAPNVFAGSAPGAAPKYVLGVHSRTGDLLGYAVIDHANADRSMGGLTLTHDLSLESAVELARAAMLQIRFLELRSGASHCLALTEEKTTVARLRDRREEFVDALRPLVTAGLCAINYAVHGDRLEPRIARHGLAASTAAATLAVVQELGIAPSRATIAVDTTGPAANECIRAITERGLRVVDGGANPVLARTDIVVVGRPLWSLDAATAQAIRARVIVAPGTPSLTASIERQLDERRILFVPSTVAGGGILHALDLRSRGLDERTAVGRTFAVVEMRARAVLEEAAATDRPLSAVLNDLLG
jgi:hypothetical protein